MPHRSFAEGRRVLVAAPFGRDADSLATIFRKEGYDAVVPQGWAEAGAMLDERTGALVATEEALTGDLAALQSALAAQPPWSDIPMIVLAANRAGRRSSAEESRWRLPGFLTNPVVLDRPLGVAALVSAVASAMRARQKQFEMRNRLAELEAGRRALAASEAELRLIADSLPTLIGFVDRDLRYRFANKAYEDWLYRSPDEVIGRTVREVVGAEAFAAREQAMREALQGRPVKMELSWPHADGRPRDAEIRYLPRQDGEGRIDGFHIFALDITDRKQTERELEAHVAERTAALTAEMESRERIEAALRQSQKMEAVGQLTGGIAHDFNNMLTGIVGSLDIMRRRLATGRTEGLERFMDAATASAQRAANLTARLLAFSRRQSLDAKPLDPNALLLSLEDLLRRTINESISLHIIPAADLPRAMADANQLESAILNLAINARDAMPGGGQLTLETRAVDLDEAYAAERPDVAPGRYVVISVTDTGVGILPEILAKVFDPFFTTKPIGQGTGLGLSMVYGFARQSGGQVRVHSTPGKGTTVSIFLRASTDTTAAATPAEPETVPDGRGQTVLVVEDDPSVRLLVREVLEELSYDPVEAEEANAAIRVLASKRRIDLMISDVGLPGMNGRQLAEVARRHRPELPILFVTGYAENAAIRAGFLGTNMAMITKPFALDALAAKVAQMLRQQGA